MESPETTEQNLEDERARLPLHETLENLDMRCCLTHFHEMSFEDRNMYTTAFDHLFELYSPEEVWDEYIRMIDPNADPNQEPVATPKTFSMKPNARADFAKKVDLAETGKADEKLIPHTFGMVEPGYERIMVGEIKRLRGQNSLRACLFGSYTRHSANECDRFVRRINPQAKTVVVDLEIESIQEARDRIWKVQGDVTQLPIALSSQDIVFTNYLLAHLYDEDSLLPSGERIMAMLNEAYRALKPGGLVVMAEHAPIAQNVNKSNIMTAILLAISMMHVGFDVSSMHVVGYENHQAKAKKQKSKIEVRKSKDIKVPFQGEVCTMPGSFEFMTMGKKPALAA